MIGKDNCDQSGFQALLEELGKTVDPRISSVRAKTPKQLPPTLAVADIRKLFSCMQGQDLLMVQLIYGSGLNLSECISLRIQDIDFKENLIHVSSGAIFGPSSQA